MAQSATPRPKKSTHVTAVAGTAWQDVLTSLGVSVKWIDDARELADLAQELADLAREGETVALDFEITGDFVAGGNPPPAGGRLPRVPARGAAPRARAR